jgi:hypothetical protein
MGVVLLNRKQRRRNAIRCYGLSVPNPIDVKRWDPRTKDILKPINMPTHVWHRKRFIMVNHHGVVVPLKSSYHGFKAIDNYKKLGKVFFHDHTYLKLLELCCNKKEFLSIFRHITVSFQLTLKNLLRLRLCRMRVLMFSEVGLALIIFKQGNIPF